MNANGHRIGTELTGSERENILSFVYSLPLSKPNSDKLEFIASLNHNDSANIQDTTRKLIARRSLARSWNWLETISLQQLSGRSKTESKSVSQLVRKEEKFNTVVLGLGYTKLKVDNQIFPRNGYRLFANVDGANPDIAGTDTQYA